MTQTVKVTYRLSPAGQKAALIAGRNAAAMVTEDMELTDMSLLDKVNIGTDGSLSLDISKSYAPDYRTDGTRTLQLDAPPATLAEAITMWDAHLARIDAEIAEQAAERKRREEEQKAAAEIKAAHDVPLVDAILTELEATDPLAPLPGSYEIPCSTLSSPWLQTRNPSYQYDLTPAQKDRINALVEARKAAKTKVEKDAEQAKIAAREAMIEEHGGYRWELEGGLCKFLGYDLWAGKQTRRWVGTFTQPKGIDTFLDGPKGEFVWDVSALSPGQCVQGGGFDTNSRGKRRNESEWFGVVVKHDDTELVVRIYDSRAAALSAARKTRKQ
jgi:hypothetical protein